ncbi:hypothetical protein CDD83_9736 [Cordyceps sp. RAO-2017]|nr:hypothetical protein CDD83_9736 [Cordyceps sp. RAO-2017]
MAASAPSSTTPDNATAYVNGRVYTVDEAQPWAEAFVVSPDGLFSAVGSTQEVLAQAERDGLVIYDLGGRFVMPGIHDAHVHALMAGLSRLSNASMGLEASVPAAEAAGKLRTAACGCSYAHAFSHWMAGEVFDVDGFDRACLDGDYPEQPVMIRAAAGHSLLLNTAALRESGYDIAAEPAAKGAFFARRPDGSLTGRVAEAGMTKALLACPKPSLAHVKRALRHAAGRLHAAGVTSCQEASANSLMLQALAQLDAEGRLRLDMHTHIVYAPEWIGEEPAPRLHALLDAASGLASRHVHTRFVKIMLDGVPLAPYFTQAGLTGDGLVDEDKICVDDVVDAVVRYDARGMTCKIHCTGQGATRRALDAIETARKKNPGGPRHEIAHCSGVHEGKQTTMH